VPYVGSLPEKSPQPKSSRNSMRKLGGLDNANVTIGNKDIVNMLLNYRFLVPRVCPVRFESGLYPLTFTTLRTCTIRRFYYTARTLHLHVRSMPLGSLYCTIPIFYTEY
jgi:hypothetical protein